MTLTQCHGQPDESYRSIPGHLNRYSESEEDPWPHTPWDVQTDFSDEPAQEQLLTRTRLLTETKSENSQSSTSMFGTSRNKGQVTQRWWSNLR